MNNEEAIKLIDSGAIPWSREFYSVCKVALERAEKYKRHDLLKNPQDLPEESKRVLCYRFDYVTGTVFCDLLWFENNCFWDRRIKASGFEVIAWREIEP